MSVEVLARAPVKPAAAVIRDRSPVPVVAYVNTYADVKAEVEIRFYLTCWALLEGSPPERGRIIGSGYYFSGHPDGSEYRSRKNQKSEDNFVR